MTRSTAVGDTPISVTLPEARPNQVVSEMILAGRFQKVALVGDAVFDLTLCLTLGGSFLTVSTPIFASNLRYPQYLHTFALLQTLRLCAFRQIYSNFLNSILLMKNFRNSVNFDGL